MFHAFIIVCAASLSMEVDESRWAMFEDAWGPYKTEENCDIRASQMASEAVAGGDITNFLISILGYPPIIYAEGHCKPPEGEPA
jgi:hypothetical protein